MQQVARETQDDDVAKESKNRLRRPLGIGELGFIKQRRPPVRRHQQNVKLWTEGDGRHGEMKTDAAHLSRSGNLAR